MTTARSVRVGLMGFGQVGRQIYTLAQRSPDIDVVAIADVGEPQILHYLLSSEVEDPQEFQLVDNFLVAGDSGTRMMRMDLPREVPWDVFDVDIVIDATGKYRDVASMQDHLDNGAPRVLLRTLPLDEIDRIVLPGINGDQVDAADRMISGGSATTTALALLLHVLSQSFDIECASMTTVHSYTSDQPLQDYAGSDFRRSRSAAKNIIPNSHEAARWIGSILPAFEGKVMTSALNVPIQEGCLLDTNLVLGDTSVGAEDINDAMRRAAAELPDLIAVAEDPIVSSDVIGSAYSLLFDAPGTIKAGSSIIKALGWYENLGHAARLLDIARLYAGLEVKEEAA
ncbi:MAG: glyceraldehyde 3-phosphate dehydrogenase NAD-binding domain-containing protein [Halioglobus sp.]|nr:glyceraldehyde 3-phosphate dehydrogenase NAD-binding domain-containing protein [Halioglobus sp.]